MIRALFICTQNRLRSLTAEQVFSTWPKVETDSTGLGNDANVPLSLEQLEWATVIFVMENAHRNKLNRDFKRHLNGKKVVCVNIADDFEFMQSALTSLLEKKAGPFLQQV